MVLEVNSCPVWASTNLASYFDKQLLDLISKLKCEIMKKVIVAIFSTVTIILFSCGGQKNTPSTSSSVDSTNVSTDTARTDTSRNQ